MMPRLLLILAATAAAPLYTRAQNFSIPVYAGFSVQAGASVWSTKLASYDRFRDAYNNFFAARLAQPLGSLRPSVTIPFGVGGHIGPLWFDVMQHFATLETDAQFTNGDRRDLKMVLRPLDLNFDLLFPMGKRLNAGMALGMQLQKGKLYSGYQYAGMPYISYAEDNPLNGVYSFYSNSSVTAGVRADIRFAKRGSLSLLTLSLRADYVGAFRKMVTTDELDKLNPHRDEIAVTASGGATYSDGQLHKYLPEDPDRQYDPYTFFVGTGGAPFVGLYRGWRFSTTLVAIPLEWNLDKKNND